MQTNTEDHTQRQAWMALLARAEAQELQALLSTNRTPSYHLPRPVESGLAMVRGRAGGTGSAFNLGEMTVTRCVVQLEDETTGVAYIRGRDRNKAEMAAVLDAQLQNGSLDAASLDPLRNRLQAKSEARAGAVASTKVEFFTMVRGED